MSIMYIVYGAVAIIAVVILLGWWLEPRPGAIPHTWTPDKVFEFLNHRLNGDGFNIYSVGSGWGERIGTEQDGTLLRWGEEIFSHTGWWTPKPHVGDLIVRKGASGFWVASMFTEVRHCGDPPDMFFAKSAPITRSDLDEGWDVMFRDHPKVLALWEHSPSAT